MFDIMHILDNSPITLLRTNNILVMGHDSFAKGEAYIFSKVVHAAQDVVAVEINCTRVAKTNPTIALRSN